MGIATPAFPVLQFAGLLAANTDQLEAARHELMDCYGPIDAMSDPLPFTFTSYYDDEMGQGLLRQWICFSTLFAPEQLSRCKHQTNKAELVLARQFPHGPRRPINIDPGYLNRFKVILASTKDHSHRVYLGDGIYGEVTLHWSKSGWTPWPWTYADYQTSVALNFLTQARDTYLKLLQQRLGPGGRG